MSKLLNRLDKTFPVGVANAPTVDRNTYEPSIPRIAFGVAGVAMSAITIAVSVILPAQMDSTSREVRVLAASKLTAPASMALATVSSIDVVAAREPRSSTAPLRLREAAPQSGWPGKATSPAVIRVSSE